jgi:hypothetical protein
VLQRGSREHKAACSPAKTGVEVGVSARACSHRASAVLKGEQFTYANRRVVGAKS